MASYGRPAHLDALPRAGARRRARRLRGRARRPRRASRPPLAPGGEFTPRARRLSRATVQRRLEEVLLELAGWLHARDGRPRPRAWPAASRSTAWPTRASGARARSSGVWVQPAAGDSGTALGAALHVAHELGDDVGADAHGRAGPRLGRRRARRAAARPPRSPSSGPDDVADAVAEALADNQVVAWFQGRSEFGPRALGHRSLLADPRDPANLEKLNDIKGREQFRPVAPMVLAERAADDLRRRPDPEPVHALHAPRARRLGGAHPRRRARRRHGPDPDRRPRARSR